MNSEHHLKHTQSIPKNTSDKSVVTKKNYEKPGFKRTITLKELCRAYLIVSLINESWQFDKNKTNNFPPIFIRLLFVLSNIIIDTHIYKIRILHPKIPESIFSNFLS